MNDEWDRILYQSGRGWKISTADALLTSEVDLERLARERNWFSVASVAEAGGCNDVSSFSGILGGCLPVEAF